MVIPVHATAGILTPRHVTTCPVCENQQPVIVFIVDNLGKENFLKLSRKKYHGEMDGWETVLSLSVKHCGVCGHFWHADQPDQESLFRMYTAKAQGRSEKPAISAKHLAAIQRRSLTLYGLVRNKVSNGGIPKLLEYGGGVGIWHEQFVKAGFSVTSYEPVSARADLSDDAENTIRTLDRLSGKTFDVINLEQVLEHIPDPLTELRRIRNYCTPETILNISVPDFGVYAKQSAPWEDFPYGRRTHLLSPFEHLHGFSAESLRLLVDRAGFKEIGTCRLVSSGALRPALRRQAARVFKNLSGTAILAQPNQAGERYAKP